MLMEHIEEKGVFPLITLLFCVQFVELVLWENTLCF